MNDSKNDPLPPLPQKTTGAAESSRPRSAETAPNSDEEPEQDFTLNEDDGPDDKIPDLRTATLLGRSTSTLQKKSQAVEMLLKFIYVTDGEELPISLDYLNRLTAYFAERGVSVKDKLPAMQEWLCTSPVPESVWARGLTSVAKMVNTYKWSDRRWIAEREQQRIIIGILPEREVKTKKNTAISVGNKTAPTQAPRLDAEIVISKWPLLSEIDKSRLAWRLQMGLRKDTMSGILPGEIAVGYGDPAKTAGQHLITLARDKVENCMSRTVVLGCGCLEGHEVEGLERVGRSFLCTTCTPSHREVAKIFPIPERHFSTTNELMHITNHSPRVHWACSSRHFINKKVINGLPPNIDQFRFLRFMGWSAYKRYAYYSLRGIWPARSTAVLPTHYGATRPLYNEKDVSEWPFKRPAEVVRYETTKYPGGSFQKPIYEPGSHMLFDARVVDMDPTMKNEPLASRGPERPMEQMNKRTKQETDEDNERIPFNVLTKQTIKFEDVTSENVREVIKTAISKQLGISLITGHLVKISEKMATGKIKLNIMCRTPCVHGSDNPKDKCSFSITGQMLGLKPEAGNVKSVEMELRARGEHSDGAIGKWRNIKNPHAAKRQHLADPKTGEKI